MITPQRLTVTQAILRLKGISIRSYLVLTAVLFNSMLIHYSAWTGEGIGPSGVIEKQLEAFDKTEFDQYGYSVSVSGDTAVVCSWLDDDDGSASGSVYVYERNNAGTNAWGFSRKITASDAAASDVFGASVFIDKDTIVVGAWGDDDVGSGSGSAYVFDRNLGGPNNWGQSKKLVASDAASDDKFGEAVAVNGDSIVVGAFTNDDAGKDSGSAYVFDRNLGGIGNWGERKKLLASDAFGNDLFGTSVTISADTVVVGATWDDDDGSQSGSAYIFERNFGGANNWGERKKLTASDANAIDYFGRSVSLSGNTLVVGALHDDDAGESSGSAYVFERDFGGADIWGERKKLTASDAAGNDQFGYEVSISGDLILIGARWRDEINLNSGAAYLFDRNQGGLENWGERTKLIPCDGSGGAFGTSVSISKGVALVGAHHGSASAEEAGVACLFFSPAIDLNGSNEAGANRAVTHAEDDGPVNLADVDLVLTHWTSDTLSSATIALDAVLDTAQEFIMADVSGTNITASFTKETGILQLSGSDSLVHYQQVLRTVKYQNTSQSPNSSIRTVTFSVFDGDHYSNNAITSVQIVGANDIPIADIFGTSIVNAIENEPVWFSGAGSDVDGSILTYTWAFGDGGSANGKDVVHLFEAPGEYIVQLVVMDGEGAVSEPVQVQVIVVSKAGDRDLFIKKASLSINWKIHANGGIPQDNFKMSARVNPLSISNAVGTITVTLQIGDKVYGAVSLDSKGKGSVLGSSKLRVRLSPEKGWLYLNFSGIDLREANSFFNEDISGKKAIRIDVSIADSENTTRMLSAYPEFEYVSKFNRTTKAQFRYAKNFLSSGVFQVFRAQAKEILNSKAHAIKVSGMMSQPGTRTVIPTGDIRLTIGQESIMIPASSLKQTPLNVFALSKGVVDGIVRFVIDNNKGTFMFATAPLPSTAIPAKGQVQNVHSLRIRFEFQTVAGLTVFDSLVIIKRKSPNSLKWHN